MLKLSNGCFAALLVLAAGCSTPTEATGPLFTDIDAARSAWLANRPHNYSFVVAPSSSWFLPVEYYVEVVNDRVSLALDPKGKVVSSFTTTIDSIWAGVLTARANSSINSAQFDARGVPREVDWGSWPVDGGVHYSVRRFSQ